MADWTNLPNQAVGVGGLPSGTTVTALRDNPVAIAEGAPGAPRVQRAAIEGDAINRVKIDTGTNSVSGTLSAGGGVDIIMNPYSFFPRVTGGSTVSMRAASGGSGPDASRFRLTNTSTDDSAAYSVAWRFINA